MDLDLLEELDFGTPIAVPFFSTSKYKDQCFLANGLERTEELRPLMEPMRPDAPRHWLPDQWSSDESSSEDEELLPNSLQYFDGVGSDFGPGGGNARWNFKLCSEYATNPPLPELVIESELGRELLRIRPRFKPRIRITRGCVETTVSEWMKKQRRLPVWDENKHDVQSVIQSHRVDGEEKRMGVWLWRGLEQDKESPNVFKIFL